jgi:hypothetical protein
MMKEFVAFLSARLVLMWLRRLKSGGNIGYGILILMRRRYWFCCCICGGGGLVKMVAAD